MKKRYRIIAAVVATILLYIGSRTYFNYKLKAYDRDNALLLQTQYIANALRLEEELHTRGVDLSEEYSSLIATKANQILKIDLDAGYALDAKLIAEMCYIADRTGSRKTGELQELLKNYYNKELKLFQELPTENEEGGIEIYENITIYNELKGTHLLDGYDLKDGLVSWFNENKSKKDKKDEIGSLIWCLYENGYINELDEKAVKKILEQEITEVKKEYESMEQSNISAVLCADELNAYYTFYYDDNRFEKQIQKIYENINSKEELEYAENDASFISFLDDFFKAVPKIDENNYIIRNISDLLLENYYGTFKES
ncbi:unknown [Clostridium sp. CAG:411]|nr:hypothetical protein [Lachnospiraceae bacterium]CDE45907.1 unknown [Clostridium sp. CAG:411]